MNYEIISEWLETKEEFLVLKKGDKVHLGRKSDDQKWKNWQECSLSNKSGWVPVQIIKPISNNIGEIIDDYSAYELRVNIGESFNLIKEVNDWYYGFVSTRKDNPGWIPKEICIIREKMITEINNNDITNLINFIKNYKAEHNNQIDSETEKKIEQEIMELITSNNSYAYKYIDQSGLFCGYMIFHIVNFPMISGKEAYITELFIDKRKRGFGLGKEFLSFAEKVARDKKCKRILLNNPKDYESYERSFYIKNGYIERDQMANFVKGLSE
jgi:GNAT superfamily N-acetyltransferase